jgi:hypothetical protein
LQEIIPIIVFHFSNELNLQHIVQACAKLLASLTRSIGSFISKYVIVRDPKRNNIRVSIEKRVLSFATYCVDLDLYVLFVPWSYYPLQMLFWLELSCFV